MNYRFRQAAALTLLLAACERSDQEAEGSRDRAGSNGVAEWTVEQTPLLSVGDSPDTDAQVLGLVSDARWLADGGLAIADAGAFAVLHFDAKGAAGPRVGRKGRGPGEFADAMTLIELPGDSTAAWDPSQRRWTAISSRTGRFRNGGDTMRVPTLLHAGLLVLSDLETPPAWVPPLLAGLSAASEEVRVAHLDERGLLWVSQDTALREWRVYADSGAPVARTTLPARVRALHFQRGAVVGVASDSTGLERVVVHRVRMGTAPRVDRTPAAGPAGAATERDALRSLLSTMVTAQEMNYMKANSYTIRADSLNLAAPPGVRVKIIDANTRGWRGVAWNVATGYTCAVYVGMAVPGGWSEGEPRCGP
jgi:hypothetical protein